MARIRVVGTGAGAPGIVCAASTAGINMETSARKYINFFISELIFAVVNN
jgi:16S rRNA G527 N7-methylase RsmG